MSNDDSDDLSDDDRAAFAQAMAGAKPLQGRQLQRLAAPKAVKKQQTPQAAPASTEAADEDFRLVIAGEKIEGRRSSVGSRDVQPLKRGQVDPEATLDLHGKNRVQAGEAIARLINSAHNNGQRCVCIVFGRGLRSPNGSVLRQATVDALTRGPGAPSVLAFVSAPSAHGGAGAVLVLVRRRR